MYLIQYAVRVKGTQCYLPRPQRRDGRGGSFLEPMDFSDPEKLVTTRYREGMLIRTFATKRAAANLLNAWLAGRHYADSDGMLSHVDPVSTRKAEHMEIVELRLELPQP
jgi:hypothetical protein